MKSVKISDRTAPQTLWEVFFMRLITSWLRVAHLVLEPIAEASIRQYPPNFSFLGKPLLGEKYVDGKKERKK